MVWVFVFLLVVAVLSQAAALSSLRVQLDVTTRMFSRRIADLESDVDELFGDDGDGPPSGGGEPVTEPIDDLVPCKIIPIRTGTED